MSQSAYEVGYGGGYEGGSHPTVLAAQVSFGSSWGEDVGGVDGMGGIDGMDSMGGTQDTTHDATQGGGTQGGGTQGGGTQDATQDVAQSGGGVDGEVVDQGERKGRGNDGDGNGGNGNGEHYSKHSEYGEHHEQHHGRSERSESPATISPCIMSGMARLWGQIEWRFGLSSLEHQLREAGVDQWPLHEETDFVGASSSIARFKGETQVGIHESQLVHEE